MIRILSVVLSFRNEAFVLSELIRRLRLSLDGLEFGYELIFVNDASTDHSLEILSREAKADSRIKIINMSRRFGVMPCVHAGLAKSKGDVVVYIDTDLQDPPELIPEMLRLYEREQADVVYTVRSSRTGESPLKRHLTMWGYKAIRWFSRDVALPVEAGDFKLLSRRCVDHLLSMEEKTIYIRGLIPWLGFKQVPIEYRREKRYAGKSKFPLFTSKGPIETFLQGVISFSNIPLYLIFPAGIITVAAGLICLIIATIQAGGVFQSVMILVGGLQLCALGVIGVYVGDIHKEAKRRPRYIIRDTINIED